MSAFLVNAACNGRPPMHLNALQHYPRPPLIARLLRERHVARFIVAPEGYGKTALALEYAETVFSFDQVYWLEGKSPCFLRDLDRRIVASTLLENPESFLVVMEDVPLLDGSRAELLSSMIDEFLDRGCEVLATCVPICDVYAKLQRDRVRLTAVDLLLADDEIDAVRSFHEREAQPVSTLLPPDRIAGLHWGNGGDEAAFLKGVMREEMPADVHLAVAVMLALQTGELADLEAFGSGVTDVVGFLAAHYPHVGIDLRGETYVTARFGASDLAAVLAGRMAALAQRSRFADGDRLIERLADVLSERGEHERACDLVRLLGSATVRKSWLSAQGRLLLDRLCLAPACALYRSLGTAASDDEGLRLGEAVRRAGLGEPGMAAASAQRVFAGKTSSESQTFDAALLLWACGNADEHERAVRYLAARCGPAWSELARKPTLCAKETTCVRVPLALMALSAEETTERALETWHACWEARIDRRQLLVGAAWLIGEEVQEAMRAGEGEKAARPRDAAEVRLRSLMHGRTRDLVVGCEGTFGFCEVVAGMALERVTAGSGAFEQREAIVLRQCEMDLFAQQRCQGQKRPVRSDGTARKRGEQRKRSSAKTGAAGASVQIAPPLTVNLFGGMDVRIGDHPVESSLFRRRKVKTLLALLVLNRGREYSRDRLVGLLWPESDLEAARKNFYGIWSQLRRALTTPSGTCPYLVRQQDSLRIEGRMLVSDVVQLEGLCRTLLFERPGRGGWAAVLSQINEQFTGDLLPSENENESIVRMRDDYRHRLVDALVGAANRLVASGEVQEGLWFARVALKRDGTREDAYTSLMRAQLAAGQRTAALETYFSCRRFLSDELGIDPSLETMKLYHAVIETEAVLL